MRRPPPGGRRTDHAPAVTAGPCADRRPGEDAPTFPGGSAAPAPLAHDIHAQARAILGRDPTGQRPPFGRALIETLPFVAWVKDKEGRFVAVNRQFAEGVGEADPERLVGRTDFDVSPREFAERYQADDRVVMETRSPRTVEEQIHLAGRDSWFETFKAPVEAEDGSVIGTVGFARDIGDRKRSERLLEVQRDLGVALAQAGCSAAAYTAIAKHALDVAGVEGVGVYEALPDRTFALRSHFGLSDGLLARVRVMPFEWLPTLVREHASAVVEMCDLAPDLLALAKGEGFRAVVVLPIERGGKLSGCLELASRRVDRIADAAVLALQTMCVHFGHVLDRLATQEALRESEARWKFALEGTGDGVWDWHVPSGRVFYSQRWKAMLGYEEHEIGGTYEDWASRVHPDDFARVEAESGRHHRGEIPNFATEHRLRRKDGSYIWVLDRGHVIEWDGNGKALRVIGIQTDISERKRSEAALRESEQFLRDVIESTSDGVLVDDGQGRVLIVNRRFGQMWRMDEAFAASRDETAMRAFVLDQLADPEGFEEGVRDLSGADRDDVGLLAFRDGRFFERYSSALVRDGQVAGRVWSFRDVTEKRRGELLFRSVIESTSDAFVAFDATLRVIDWSPQAEQLFGWTAAEVVGRAATGVIWPVEVAATLSAGLARYVKDGQSRVVGRVWRQPALRKDGTQFPAELQLGASHIGGEWRFSGFVRDVTERVLADERLAQAEKLEAIGQLTGGLAHDFNNLLGILIGNLDLFADASSEDERQELLQAMRVAADRGADVTRALLAIARRQQLAPRSADLNSLLRELAPLLRHTAGKRVRLSIEASAEPLLSHVDQGGFNNALLNLIINARDAMPEGGEIHVRTDVVQWGTDAPAPLVDGHFNVVEVGDTGMGMPPEVAARAFDPFFTTKGRGQGTGLGLAMVYAFARQSGGTAVIRSTVARGTTVRLYLPQAAEEPPLRWKPSGPSRDSRSAARNGCCSSMTKRRSWRWAGAGLRATRLRRGRRHRRGRRRPVAGQRDLRPAGERRDHAGRDGRRGPGGRGRAPAADARGPAGVRVSGGTVGEDPGPVAVVGQALHPQPVGRRRATGRHAAAWAAGLILVDSLEGEGESRARSRFSVISCREFRGVREPKTGNRRRVSNRGGSGSGPTDRRPAGKSPALSPSGIMVCPRRDGSRAWRAWARRVAASVPGRAVLSDRHVTCTGRTAWRNCRCPACLPSLPCSSCRCSPWRAAAATVRRHRRVRRSPPTPRTPTRAR